MANREVGLVVSGMQLAKQPVIYREKHGSHVDKTYGCSEK